MRETIMRDFPRAKSLLFVAATRREEFENAFGSEADAVILDLEDSVPSERKNEGRANILAFCQANPSAKFFVRITGVCKQVLVASFCSCMARFEKGLIFHNCEGLFSLQGK